MQQIEFYFDPSCPFCWVTSRWLLLVSNKRPLEITWRPFSLAIKNNELSESDGRHLSAHRVLRVMMAASKQGANLGELYTAFGISHFLVDNEYDDKLISEVLSQKGLDGELAKAADDQSLDQQLEAEMQSALDVIGQDIGVPAIIFSLPNGDRRGYFGPVLDSLPEMDEALKLYDGLLSLATSSHFFELKRGRDQMPDVFSTAKC